MSLLERQSLTLSLEALGLVNSLDSHDQFWPRCGFPNASESHREIPRGRKLPDESWCGLVGVNDVKRREATWSAAHSPAVVRYWVPASYMWSTIQCTCILCNKQTTCPNTSGVCIWTPAAVHAIEGWEVRHCFSAHVKLANAGNNKAPWNFLLPARFAGSSVLKKAQIISLSLLEASRRNFPEFYASKSHLFSFFCLLHVHCLSPAL